MKNKEGEAVKTRQGIANVFAKFYEELYIGEEENDNEDTMTNEETDTTEHYHNTTSPQPTQHRTPQPTPKKKRKKRKKRKKEKKSDYMDEFTTEEIQSAIDRLKKGKAKDSNGIRAEQLKICSEETNTEEIRTIFNEIAWKRNGKHHGKSFKDVYLWEEENRVIKDLLAGNDAKPGSAEKQRWADVEESEEDGVNEVEKQKKTDWMALLEVAREKDVGNAEKGKWGREWEVRDEGKGKTRSGTRESKGKGPSSARMVPNMGAGGSHSQTMRVPEETGDETEGEEVRREKEEDGKQDDGRGGKKVAETMAERVLEAAEEKLDKAETMKEAASRELKEVKEEGEGEKGEMRSGSKIVVTQQESAETKEEEERDRLDEQWESVRRRELSSHDRREAEEWGEKVGEELKAAARKEELSLEDWESRKRDGETWREVMEERRE